MSHWRRAKRQVGKLAAKGGLEFGILRAKLGNHAGLFD